MPFLRGEMFSPEGSPVTPVDPYSLELGSGRTLISPLDPPEVWCAGVTYERSRDARMEESAVKDVYDLVYDAHRPELFLKDAGSPSHRRPRASRSGSAATRPGTCRSRRSGSWSASAGAILALHDRERRLVPRHRGRRTRSTSPRRRSTRARARSARRSTSRRGSRSASRSSCASPTRRARSSTRTRRRRRNMVRTFEELTSWLVRENPVPPGSVLLTGTGLVPPDVFSLVPGHWVEIHVPEIGTLVNPVALRDEPHLKGSRADDRDPDRSTRPQLRRRRLARGAAAARRTRSAIPGARPR